MIIQETSTPPTAPSAATPDRAAPQDPASASASTPPPRPSLASLSFTQLLSLYDDAPAHARGAPTSAAAARTEATLSVHDCVLLKLSLTCALCGGLLRHQPTAIETCGHCFCYRCINDAIEDGCAPLTAQWPWSTLAAEAAAAEARWRAAAARPPPLERAQPSAAPPSATVHSSRKSRKVRQQCPLCLAPAFKWMLVPLPPLAQLCSALHAAHPCLEDTLALLDADAVHPAPSALHDRGTESPPASASALASGAADLVLSAFAPRTSAHDGLHCPSEGDEGSDGVDAGDEEAERWRRRSSGGPRKEITFAAELVARVSGSTVPGAPCVAASARGRSPVTPGEREEAEAEEREESRDDTQVGPSSPVSDSHPVHVSIGAAADVPLWASTGSLQLSADLIPSPAAPGPCLFKPLAAAPPCRDEVLGHSPAEEVEAFPSGGAGIATPLDEDVDNSVVLPPIVVAAPAPPLLPSSSPPPWRLLLDAAPLHRQRSSGGSDDSAVARLPSLGELRAAVLGAAPHEAGNWSFVCDSVPMDAVQGGCLAPHDGDASHAARAYSSLVDADDVSGAALESASDIWALETALVRRHPRLPRCVAALRVGRLQWDGHAVDGCSDHGAADGSTARASAAAAVAPIACVMGHYPAQAPTAPASASPTAQLRRTLPVLSPTACTAVLLGVPCLDVAWVSAASTASPASSASPAAPWLPYAVESWRESDDAVAGGSPAAPQRRNAFQALCDRLQSTLRDTAGTPPPQHHRRRCAAPAAWMAATRHTLLAHLQSPWRRVGAEGPAGRTHLFLLLPDGAVRLLGRLLARRGASGAAVPPGGGEPGVGPQGSRKRPRDADGAAEGGPDSDTDWDVTDGHAQASWRRLVLVAGGAVVELQRGLFHALAEVAAEAAATAAVESDDRDADGNSVGPAEVPDLVAAATTLLQRRLSAPSSTSGGAGGGSRGSWVHVDVACTGRDAEEVSEHEAAPHHTLLLLYSATAAQRSVAEAQERDAPAHTATRRFHRLLHRVAGLVAEAVTPVLPGGAVRHEARPAHWLLENIAEGRRSAGSYSTAPASASTLGGSDGASECRSDDDGGGPASVLPSTQEAHPSTAAGSAKDVPSQGASLSPVGPAVCQRAGVYRSLLYADTP